ncbi:hypothetical protein BCR43DRAFT_519462 [Syncephalastrum racemosum]|uniref:Secreted protein n=1 Tax=Syncephalastrum racemosum TaxID=13706 RepID=A0A1X2GYT7_SYNRA|nr:hypothetical protein BCR43DRAFT_519462 [Syncephalastrum racemosum]
MFLFHFIWLSFFGAYDLRPTVERDVTRGYFKHKVPICCLDITLAATFGTGQFSNGSSLNRMQPPYAARINMPQVRYN